jgi:hypothetical protein
MSYNVQLPWNYIAASVQRNCGDFRPTIYRDLLCGQCQTTDFVFPKNIVQESNLLLVILYAS